MEIMKKSIFAGIAVMLLASACGGGGNGTANTDTRTDSIKDLTGNWRIENVVENDSSYAKPQELTPGEEQYFTFNADSTFSVTTNCNSIQGTYVMNGDSLRFEPGLMTQMACDNTKVEDLLRKVMPEVRTIEFENDSTARLNTTSSPSYIILVKGE